MKRSQQCPQCRQTVSQTPVETGAGLWMTCPYCSKRWLIERKKEPAK